jgi:hypothetical protein
VQIWGEGVAFSCGAGIGCEHGEVTLVLVLVTAFLIFAIAAVTVGQMTFSAARTARQAVFDLDEAVDYVADRLPYEVQARLSHDDVRRLLSWYLDELEAKRVAYERDEERLPEDAGQDIEASNAREVDDAALENIETLDEIVVDEDRVAAKVLGRAEKAKLDVTDVDVLLVLGECEQYLIDIGAIGGRAD